MGGPIPPDKRAIDRAGADQELPNRLEADLHGEGRRLATLLSNLPGIAYRCNNDRDWTMEFVSDGCEALTGYKAIDLIGNSTRSYNSLIHPDDQDRIWSEVQDALSRRVPYRLTYRIIAADGREKWVWEQGVGIFSGNDLEALEGFITDITDRKVAESALQAAEKKYRELFDGALEGIYRTTPQGKSLDVNVALARTLGYDSAIELVSVLTDTTNQLWLDPRERSRFVQLLETGDVLRDYECRFKRKDGTPLWASVTCREVRSADGQDAYYQGFVIDITERKRMEEALRKSEDKFSKAFLSSPAIVTLSDLSEGGRLIEVNEAFERHTGYARDEVIGRTTRELGLWADSLELDELLNRVKADGMVRNFEAHFRRRNGDAVTGLVSVEPFELDGRPCAISATIDITDRKAAEEALRKAEEKFEKVFLSSPVAKGIIDLQDNGRIVDVNQAFERITGYRRDEVIGCTELNLWADPDRRGEAFRQLQVNGSIHNFENRFRRKNGDIGVGLISMDTFSIDGKPHAIVANIDITERVRAEEEKAQLEGQLRQAQKLESVGRLAGGVAHDFNNLLTVINGYADFVIAGLDPQDPLSSSAQEIRAAGERAAILTKQLLAFSRKQIIEPKILDLNATLRDSERMLRRLIGEDIVFVTRLDSRLGQVMADPEQIHQVAMNLVVNARDAMPDGGKVEIGTRNVDVSDAEAAVHADAKPGRYVMMAVTDTGRGMDEKTRQHIFEPFFTTKDRDRGTGLGLSTVYGIVRQSGGWIDVSSELGVGTTFKIYFPRIHETPVEGRRPATRTGRRQGGETILVVEDLDAVRRLTKAMLVEYGYRVLEAANGGEAIDIAQRCPDEIHLLLTDVVLPGLNGKDLSERLKALRPTLKVIFVSGYPADVIASRGVLDLGVAYLPKPFTTDGLTAKVREVLDGPPAPQ